MTLTSVSGESRYFALMANMKYLSLEDISYQREAVLFDVCVIAIIDFKA